MRSSFGGKNPNDGQDVNGERNLNDKEVSKQRERSHRQLHPFSHFPNPNPKTAHPHTLRFDLSSGSSDPGTYVPKRKQNTVRPKRR
jgi:hypothetical protein